MARVELAHVGKIYPNGFRARLAQDPILRRALPVVADERFFD